MPTLDTLRRRISVTEEQLEVLRLVSNGELTHLSDATAPLVAAGLINADGPAPEGDRPVVHAVAQIEADSPVAAAMLLCWVRTSSRPSLSAVCSRSKCGLNSSHA